jgi:hypothetical protein
MAVSHTLPEEARAPAEQGPPPEPREPATPFAVALGRLAWMLFGPFALALSVLALLTKGKGLLAPWDAAYFAALGATLLGRWAEYRGGHPLTAEGEPATPDHLRRYLRWGLTVGLTVWAAAVAARNLWSAG